MMINKQSEQVLLGSLLGDGYINRRQLSNGEYRYRYQEIHTIKQKDYALDKSKILDNVATIKNSSIIKSVNNKKFGYITIRSLDSLSLKKYHNLFYKNKRKIITKAILDILTPLGIAYWFMDDGTYDYWSKWTHLSTNSFSLQEHKLIKDWFEKEHHLKCNIAKDGRGWGYYIRFNVKETKKFIDLIRPYIHKSMTYKLGTKNNKRKKIERAIKKYYNTNKLRILKNRRVYRKENEDRISKWKKEYHIKNKLKIAQNHHKYYIEHKRIISKKNKRYKRENKEKIKEVARRYYKLNRDIILPRMKRYYYEKKKK